jgi:hypothetical protein
MEMPAILFAFWSVFDKLDLPELLYRFFFTVVFNNTARRIWLVAQFFIADYPYKIL